jgi:membrane peptidoglycan carboxypeptidase
LVSMDPKTGQILAMLGTVAYNSPDFGQFNEAVNPFDPGSTIKLFTYTAAIASRELTVRTPIDTGPSNFNDGSPKLYQPLNYDRQSHGICILERCLPNSYNVPAVKVEAHVGINLITNLEIAAGISTFIDPQNRPAPNQYSATLGGLYRGITPLDLADGASTIASLGVHHDPAPVLKIVDRATSRVLYAYDAAASGRRVVPQNVAYIITEVTSNDANRAAAFGAHGPLTLPDRRVSAKTGTAENFKANWTVGWTPSLLTVVLVTNPRQTCLNTLNLNDVKVAQQHGLDPSTPLLPSDVQAIGLKPVSPACGPLTNGLAAAIGAAPIWNTYMTKALQGKPQEWYTRPPDVVAQNGNDDNADFFLPGTENQPLICSYYAAVFDPNNKCLYMGTTAPPPPTPSPSPSPDNGNGNGNGGGNGKPTPKPGG